MFVALLTKTVRVLYTIVCPGEPTCETYQCGLQTGVRCTPAIITTSVPTQQGRASYLVFVHRAMVGKHACGDTRGTSVAED